MAQSIPTDKVASIFTGTKQMGVQAVKEILIAGGMEGAASFVEHEASLLYDEVIRGTNSQVNQLADHWQQSTGCSRSAAENKARETLYGSEAIYESVLDAAGYLILAEAGNLANRNYGELEGVDIPDTEKYNVNQPITDFSQQEKITPIQNDPLEKSILMKAAGGEYNSKIGQETGKGQGEVSVGQSVDDSGPIFEKDLNQLPENARNAYGRYDKAGWKGNVSGQTSGTNAGGKYFNKDGQLPTIDVDGKSIMYKEWDVNNKQPEGGRDGERFITGSDGSVYYTDSHYGESRSPTGLPPFIKIR